MSDNHRHQPQDERRLIREKQPTGNRLLDDLAGTVPRANPDFQQELEDRLLASLKHKEKRNAQMIATDRYPDAKKTRRFSVPLTLAAAMLALLVAGSVLLSMSGGSPNWSFLAQAQPSATPTFIPTSTPIVILHSLPAVIVAEEGVTMYAGPGENHASVERLESGTSVVVVGRTEDSQWLYIQTELRQSGWIRSEYVQQPMVAAVQATPTATIAGWELTTTAMTTPVVQAAPVTATSTAIGWELTTVPSPDDIPHAVATVIPTVVPPAPSMEITLLPADDLQPVVIALHELPGQTRLTAEDLAVVYWPVDIVPEGTYSDIETLLGASEIVSPQRAIPQWQPILATDLVFGLGAILPPDKVAISLPLQPSQALSLQDGAVVDVYAAMLFVDIEADFQMLATPADISTPVPGREPQLVTQRILDDAQVIHVGAFGQAAQPEETPDIITLAVSPQDATVLTWMVEARVPIFFLPHDAEPVNLQVGSELMLLGYTTDHQQGSLRFTLYWYAHEQSVEDYRFFVNVLDESRQTIIQHDTRLIDGEGTVSGQWAQGTIAASEHRLNFAESPGEYTVRVGLFRASDGVRLPIISPAASDETRIADDNSLLLYRFTQE